MKGSERRWNKQFYKPTLCTYTKKVCVCVCVCACLCLEQALVRTKICISIAMQGWSSQLWRTFGGCVCVKPYSREANIRIVQLSMSCCHTSWTLPWWHPNSQTSDLEQSVCALNVCSATTWCLCVSVRALNSVQSGDPIGQCQESSSPHTKAQTHIHTLVQHIISITSRPSNELFSLRWLTFSVFEPLPIEDFFTCRDLSVWLCVMLCPTLYLLPC